MFGLTSTHDLIEDPGHLGDGGHLIITVGVVEVDVVGLEALQGSVDGGADISRILRLVLGVVADLRGDDDLVAVASGSEPGADDGL